MGSPSGRSCKLWSVLGAWGEVLHVHSTTVFALLFSMYPAFKVRWKNAFNYLRQRGMWSVLSVCLSVCLFVCVQDYCNTNQPISSKLGAVIRPTNLKNRLISGGDPVPVTETRSLFHFSRIEDFRILISISHFSDFYDTWRNDWCRQDNKSVTFWQRSSNWRRFALSECAV